MTSKLTDLRTALTTMGVTAQSPTVLDAEAERIASEDRWT